MIDSRFERLPEKYPTAKYYKVNVIVAPGIVEEYRIAVGVVPTIVVFEKGEEKDRHVAHTESGLNSFVSRLVV